MSEINFAVRAPDEATFWSSWQAAGICTAPHEYTPEYRDHIEVRDWGSGQITTQTGVDGNGDPIMSVKSGWYANVRVTGSLVAEFTHGLDQYNEDGTLKSIWDRTWATMVFQLEWQDRDPATNFPAGYFNSQGVSYADMADIVTPYEVRQ
jgi:hypothetical protein